MNEEFRRKVIKVMQDALEAIERDEKLAATAVHSPTRKNGKSLAGGANGTARTIGGRNMTNKEAAKILKSIEPIQIYSDDESKTAQDGFDVLKAMDLAIKALESGVDCEERENGNCPFYTAR